MLFPKPAPDHLTDDDTPAPLGPVQPAGPPPPQKVRGPLSQSPTEEELLAAAAEEYERALDLDRQHAQQEEEHAVEEEARSDDCQGRKRW